MKSKDVAEKYDLEEDRIGVIGESAQYTSSGDNKWLCSMRVDAANLIEEEVHGQTDEYKFALVGSLFKKFFDSHFHPSHMLEEDLDIKFWLMVELPKGFFKEEVKLGVEGGKTNGMYFHISEEELEGVGKYTTVVNVEDEDE